MQPDPIFTTKLRQARGRLELDRLARYLGDALLVGGAAGLLALVVQKLFALPLLTPLSIGIAGGLLLVAVAVRWLLTRPTPFQVALAVDRRLALKERFSTVVALADVGEPFAEATRREVYACAARVDVRRSFPLRLTRRWYHAVGCWAALGLLFLFVPNCDLLGRAEANERRRLDEQRLQQAKTDVKEQVTKIETVTTRLNDPNLADDLASLMQMQQDLKPAEVRREAIRRLGDLAENLRQQQNSEKVQSVEALQDKLRGLKSSQTGPLSELSKALQKGDFQKASDLAKALQKKLSGGDLSPEEKQKLAEEMSKLAAELDKLAQEQKDLEQALAAAGLDKKLAELDTEALRKKLAEKGLDPATIEKLLQKASACKSACSACKGMGKSLKACSGGSGEGSSLALSPDALDGLTDELDELEAMQARLQSMRASIGEIEDAIACLGAGNCQGLGGKGPFAPGDSNRQGNGSGGPGKGSGEVDTAGPSPTSTKATRVKNPDKTGPIIAVWESQEEQVRGEAGQELKDVVQATRDAAAEAISENEIPARYQPAVQQYVSELEKSTDEK